jgi:uncharacterized protein (TIGR03435 family)
MVAHLPKWFSEDSYVINAQAEGDPTKDQMRLMMQSLLADRFKLAVHFERQELPVLALGLDKPEKTGPKLYPHSKGLLCDGPFPRNVIVAAPTKSTDVFPPFCGKVLKIGLPNGSILMGGRDLTMAQIALMLSVPDACRILWWTERDWTGVSISRSNGVTSQMTLCRHTKPKLSRERHIRWLCKSNLD